MPYIMNCLNKLVSVQAHGKWFTFKPNEIKLFYQPEIARFLGQMRGEEGLVEIPDDIAEKRHSENPQEKSDFNEYIKEKRKEGIASRLRKLEWQRHNLLTSLKFDIESKGMKMDPLILATKGDLSALKELNELQGVVIREGESIAEQVRRELGLENGNTSSSESGAVNPGRKNPTEPAKAGK